MVLSWIADPRGVGRVGLSAMLESSVAQLESLFVKAEEDLDYITRKLDAEFAMKYAHEGCDHVLPFS